MRTVPILNDDYTVKTNRLKIIHYNRSAGTT